MKKSPLENFGMQLAETARTWRNKLDQRLKPLGLSQAKWVVLVHMSRAGDTLTQKELAQLIGIEGPTLVGLLDRLGTDGLVERRESVTDRRSKTVHLTAAGSAVMQQISEVARDLRGELFKGIEPAELLQCLQTLELLKQRLDLL